MKKKDSQSQAIVPSQGSKRKQYDLPGQIHDPPEESEPLRIFYESLYNQRPDSEIAQIWMMENGLLDEDDAVRVQKIKANRRGVVMSSSSSQRTPTTARASAIPKVGSAGKSSGKGKVSDELVPLGKPAAKKPSKATPKKVTYDDDSDDEKPLTKMKKR